MIEYVLIHPKPWKTVDLPVLLVLKEKPAWQKGRLNLVGGKVEEGETPEEAAYRELKEEAGWPALRMRKMGEIIGVNCLIHCFSADIAFFYAPNPRSEEIEKVEWYTWSEVKNDCRLIPNLRIIIPLLHTEIKGWRILDQESSVGVNCHKISVELPIDVPFVNGEKCVN